MKQFASYLRVSTQRQGAQGLGISAQRMMCENFIQQNNGVLVQEFMDVESGTHRDRKGLWQAIEYCNNNNCGLVIAKLDRLARDVEFTFKVINTGIDIHFTDMPIVNSMILGVFASVAQYEREMVSSRTKQALAAKRARGELIAGAAPKWKETYNNKTENQRKKEAMEKGERKRANFQGSRDTKTFLEILKKEFPSLTQGNPEHWQWTLINCKRPHLGNMLGRMQEYKTIDSRLFARWNFDLDCDQKLRCYMHTIKRSYGAVNC